MPHEGDEQVDAVPVLVVDDQASFRAVMRDVVEATPGFHLVGEADSGPAAVEAVGRLRPQLVIMDKRMPGMSGLHASREITSSHPEVVVLLCSVEDAEPELAREYGAAAMTNKAHLSTRVVTEVWKAARAVA